MAGSTYLSFSPEFVDTTGCNDTALEMTVRTPGTRPAHVDIMKLVDPWQWAMTWISRPPLCSMTVLTARGWSSTAAWSSVQVLLGTSMLARQVSSHTS